MTDTIIVSGGDIQRDFALDFLKREIEKTGREKNLPDRSRSRTGIFSEKSDPAGCGSRRF